MMEHTAQQAFLICEEGTLKGRKIPISKPSLTIGRGGQNIDCDIVLPERQVSRQHAQVYLDEGLCYVRDLGSKNGTYVNDQPITEAVRLQDGDRVQIALCARFRFVGADATLPLEAIQPANKMRLDKLSRRVWIGTQEISPPLSPAQYRLLELLYELPGQVRSRDEIVDAVWSETEREGVSEQAIDALVRRLRERVAEVSPDGDYIVTVRGHGFRLDPTGGQ